jgi:hypothetical protein
VRGSEDMEQGQRTGSHGKSFVWAFNKFRNSDSLSLDIQQHGWFMVCTSVVESIAQYEEEKR